jgi:hypothetical protein
MHHPSGCGRARVGAMVLIGISGVLLSVLIPAYWMCPGLIPAYWMCPAYRMSVVRGRKTPTAGMVVLWAPALGGENVSHGWAVDLR